MVVVLVGEALGKGSETIWRVFFWWSTSCLRFVALWQDVAKQQLSDLVKSPTVSVHLTWSDSSLSTDSSMKWRNRTWFWDWFHRISPLLVSVSSSFSVCFRRGYNVVGQNPEVFSGDAFNMFGRKKQNLKCRWISCWHFFSYQVAQNGNSAPTVVSPHVPWRYTDPVAVRRSHLGVHLEAAGKAAAGHRVQQQLRSAEHLRPGWPNGGWKILG